MNEAIKSNILTLVLTNHASGDISHGNIYTTDFYPSECVRHMTMKLIVHMYFLVCKNVLSAHLNTLLRFEDKRD